MKCPKCMHEIKEDAIFCGYCGGHLQNPAVESKENTSAEEIIKESIEAVPQLSQENIGAETVPETKMRKKRTGFKVWLVFMILAVLSGGIWGFLEAKEIINIFEYIPKEYMDNLLIHVDGILDKINSLINSLINNIR